MNISLNKSLEEFIKHQLETGLYNSASEVVRAGLRALQEKEADINQKIAISLKQIEEGNFNEVNNSFWKEFEQEVISEIEEQNKLSKKKTSKK